MKRPLGKWVMKKVALIEAIIIVVLIAVILVGKKTASTNAPTVVYNPENDVAAIRSKAFFNAQPARIKAEQDCPTKLLGQWESEHQKR